MGDTILSDVRVNNKDIPIIFEESKALPIVSMQIVFTNSGQLSQNQDGLADMSAALLNEGTKKEGSLAFATKLDDRAISISTYTGRENFVIVASCLKSEFQNTIDFTKELLSDPNYSNQTLSKIKMQKLGKIEQKKSDFDYQAALKLRTTLFENTPLANNYEGTKESISTMKLLNVKEFITSHLGYNNAIIVIGGDLSEDEAKGATKELLSSLPQVALTPIKHIEASPKEQTRYEYSNDTQQAYIYFGAPFDFGYDSPQQYKAKIAEYILGSAGFGSRIMEEIRVKRGLAYSAYASFQRGKSASYLSGYLQTKLENEEEAKKIVKDVINDFVADGITQKELDEAKEFLIGSEALMVETLSQRLGRAFNDYYYDREIGFSSEQNRLLESVTLKEMNAFIASHPEIAKISFGIVTKK